MATTKTNRQSDATRQKEAKLNRQIEEERRVIKQLKDELKAHQKVEEQLVDQKRKLKKNKKKHAYHIVWDDNTPLIELVFPWKMARFKKMLGKWQNYSHEMINPLEVTHFNYDLQYQSLIFADLKTAMSKNDHLFDMSDRQIIKYMSTHSNLGGFDKIKKAIQRLE